MTALVTSTPVPERCHNRILHMFGPFLGEHNLNLGCARDRAEGWTNLDISPNVGADIVHDLEVLPLPFPDATWDCIFGSHVFEHIHRERFIPLAGELARILRPGGYLISVTPYCTSTDAVDNPFHLQAFSAVTWHYADRRMYETPGHAGFGDFGVSWDLPVIETRFVPHDAFRHLPEHILRQKMEHEWNVIRELHVIMQKPREA